MVVRFFFAICRRVFALALDTNLGSTCAHVSRETQIIISRTVGIVMRDSVIILRLVIYTLGSGHLMQNLYSVIAEPSKSVLKVQL